MFNTDYRNLEFTHFVAIHSENGVFGCARDSASGRIKIYLIGNDGCWVRERRNDSWFNLERGDADFIRSLVQLAYQDKKPVYRASRFAF